MKQWIFKDAKDKVIWETTSKKYAEEFTQLLEKRGIYYVITIQES